MQPVRQIGDRKQLFLDDWIIKSREGLRRVAHRGEKRPEGPV